MTLEIQALTILHMVGAGVYLGITYDTYSHLRLKKKNQWMTLIQDVMFWLLNVLFIFLWLQAINNGEMRIHVLLSLLCGYAMYKALFQKTYQNILEKVIRTVIYTYRLILRIIHTLIIKPILLLYKLLVALLLFILATIVRCGQLLYSCMLFIARPFSRLYLLGKGKIKAKRKQYIEKKSIKKENQKKGIFQWVAKWLLRRKRK